MNRSIKFRAWHIAEKHWLTESELQNSDRVPVISHGDHFELDDTVNVIYCQFTGLLDENSKEVFEGDIVSSQWGNLEIKWSNQFACFTPSIVSMVSGYVEFEVIGNIFENPELLPKT